MCSSDLMAWGATPRDGNNPALLNPNVSLPDYTLTGKILKNTAQAGSVKQGTYTFQLILTDSRTGTPQERLLQGEEMDILKRLMDCISDREATILRMRYGLDGSEVYTLAQISETLNISRERVRQVADEALTKLNQRLTTGRWPEASMKERDEERLLVKAAQH